MSWLRYESTIDLAVDNAHTRVIRLVGANKRVLELGCASGFMGEVLIERFGCAVTGVERDAEAAARARGRGLRMIEGDLDGLDLARELGDERFEVAICADVLEHLREPGRTLRAIRELLTPEGYVVASVPNICHVSIIAELLEGRFPYGPVGLLDDTHLRFFTRSSLFACFREAGFVIAHLERVCLEPAQTEFRTDVSRFPPEVQAVLCSREEGTTYQFIVRAEPAATSALALRSRETPRPGPAAPAAPAVWIDAARTWMSFLEDERTRQRRELEEVRAWNRELQALVQQRDMQLAEVSMHLTRRDAQLAETAAHLAQRDVQLAATAAHRAQRDIELAATAAHLAQRDVELAATAAHLAQRDVELAATAAHLAQRDVQLAATVAHLARRDAELTEMQRQAARPAGWRRLLAPWTR